jgi:hypothetical protein
MYFSIILTTHHTHTHIIPGNTKGGKDHCIVDPLFYWLGLVYFENKNKQLSVVIQLIPNQSNIRSTVQ